MARFIPKSLATSATRRDTSRHSVQESRPDSKDQQMLMLGQMLLQVQAPHKVKVVVAHKVINPSQEFQLSQKLKQVPSNKALEKDREATKQMSEQELTFTREEVGVVICPEWCITWQANSPTGWFRKQPAQ